jgi:adenylate cyclase
MVRNHVGNKLEIDFLDQGEKIVKNVARPVQVFFIRVGNGATSGAQSAGASGQPQARPDRPSVTVLPFTNMSEDPEQEFFSDGITENIISDSFGEGGFSHEIRAV